MPTLVMRQAQDPLKRYKWAVLGVFLLAVGGASIFVLLQRKEPVAGSNSQLNATEQSLDSLQPLADSSAGQAPGGLVAGIDGGNGPYAKKMADISNPESMLYQSSPISAPGAPITTQEAAALKNSKNGNSLAQALSQIASGSKADKRGWGGETPRTGLSSRGGFGALSGLSSGGSSTSAGYSSPSNYNSSSGSSGGTGSAGTVVAVSGQANGGPARVHEGTNQSLNNLRQAEALLTQAATMTKADQIAGMTSRPFDGSTTKANMNINAGGGSGVSGISDEAAPANLSADPPSTAKNIQPPKVPDPKQVQTPQQQEQQMEQMIIQAAMGGILGPLFGGVGSSIASSMGFAAANSFKSVDSSTVTDGKGNVFRKQ